MHRALRMRAARHGRSTEAEVREILEAAVKPEGRVKPGSLIAGIGQESGLTDEEHALLQSMRDRTPARPLAPAAGRR